MTGNRISSYISNPDYQLNDHWSLQTDTASYFLTVNPSTPNKRLVGTVNNIAGNTLSPEPYFMYTLGNYLKGRINIGNAQKVQESYVYSSAYDKDEGYTSGDIAAGAKLKYYASQLACCILQVLTPHSALMRPETQ